MNCVTNKIHFITDILHTHNLDILSISETWLLTSMPDSFVAIPGYSIIRNDTNGTVPKHGTCLYIREGIKYDHLDRSCPNTLSINLVDHNVCIIGLYRPPSYTDAENNALVDFLLKACETTEVVLLGDFNLPSIVWSSDGVPTTCNSTTDSKFVHLFTSLGLFQWVLEPSYPRSGSILDLVLSSEPGCIADLSVLPPLPGCDHCMIKWDVLLHWVESDKASVINSKRQWQRGKYNKICDVLMEVDWEYEFAYLDVNASYQKFLAIVSPLVAKHVPAARDKSCQRPPWQIRPPSSLISARTRAWVFYKDQRSRFGRRSTEATAALGSFFVRNREVKNHATVAQARYEQSLILRSVENPKLFHAYVKGKKVGRPGVGPVTLPSGEISDNPTEMTECFASSFASVYNRHAPADPSPHQICDSRLSTFRFTVDDVLKILLSLDASSAMGSDRIHPCFLKCCASVLCKPLFLIFNRSLMEGDIPHEWKQSLVIPIFKKGSRYDPLNYRPISLTSVACKCMERLVVDQLYKYLEVHNILSSEQFGFRSGRSTMDQLLLSYNDVSDWLDSGMVVDLILFDFSKAFDVVCHSVLLRKLQSIGIHGHLLRWIERFLLGRTMRVSIQGAISSQRSVDSGVPQGSVLGPVLFLIYINHVAAHLSCKFKIFADDLKIFMGIRDPISVTNTVSHDAARYQLDIDCLCRTAKSWGLDMNHKKCTVLRFKRKNHDVPAPTYHVDGIPLCVTRTQSDLGVVVDDSLKFHDHVQRTAHKAGGLAQNLLKCTVCRSREFMLQLLVTHIRPVIEYCSCVWNTGYHQDVRLLESVQRRWTKKIEGLQDMDYGSRLRALDLFSVQGRLLRADLIQYWRILNGKSVIEPDDLFLRFPASSRTRGHRLKISHRRTQTEARRRFFSFRHVDEWNCLPEAVVMSLSLSSFKSSLALTLGDKLFRFLE